MPEPKELRGIGQAEVHCVLVARDFRGANKTADQFPAAVSESLDSSVKPLGETGQEIESELPLVAICKVGGC